MNRETDISAEHVKEKWCAKRRDQSSQAADHVVVTFFLVERVHLPRTNNDEVAQCCEVQLEDGSDHDEQLSDRGQRKNHDQQRQW